MKAIKNLLLSLILTLLFAGASIAESGVFTAGKTARWKGDVDVDTHTFKVAILNNSYAFNPDHDSWSDVSSYEITGTGYTAGGQALTGVVATSEDGLNLCKFDADNAVWNDASFSGYHAVIYDDTNAADVLIASIDFGGIKTVTAGTFTLNFSASGIITE